MDVLSADDVSANLNGTSVLASWNRPRSSEELRAFVDRMHDHLPADLDLGV